MERIRTFTQRGRRVTGTDINKLFQTLGEIRIQIDVLKKKIEDVRKLHGEIIISPITEEEKNDELDTLNSEIKHYSLAIRANLKVIEKSIVQQEAEEARKTKSTDKCSSPDSGQSEVIQLVTHETGNSAKLRIFKTQFSTYLKLYTDVMNDYTEAQIEHRDRCRIRLRRQLEITNATTYTDQQIEDMIEDGNFAVFTQGIISNTTEAKRALAHLKKRHTALKKLEKSIELLADLFSDMAVTVEAQGEKIDNIAVKTDTALDEVTNAGMEIQAAVKEKRKYTKRKIIFGVLILVVIGIVISVVVCNVTHCGSSSSSPPKNSTL